MVYALRDLGLRVPGDAPMHIYKHGQYMGEIRPVSNQFLDDLWHWSVTDMDNGFEVIAEGMLCESVPGDLVWAHIAQEVRNHER